MGRPAIIRLNGLPLRMTLPPFWHGPKLVYSLDWIHERDLVGLCNLIDPGSVVVDVGAHIGLWSLVLSHVVQSTGAVVACEPSQRAFAILSQNISLNHLTNIRPLRLALSHKKGVARLYQDIDFSRHSLGNNPARKHLGSEEVRTDTLDSVMLRSGLHRLDLIKIDVEGAEELVLRGATESLRRFRPLVLFEINRQAAASVGLKAAGAWSLLKGLDYHFFEISETGQLLPLEMVPAGGNVLACGSSESLATYQTARWRDSFCPST